MADASHPRSQDIYGELESLNLEMKEVGYLSKQILELESVDDGTLLIGRELKFLAMARENTRNLIAKTDRKADWIKLLGKESGLPRYLCSIMYTLPTRWICS